MAPRHVITDRDCLRHRVVRLDDDPRIAWTACEIRVVLFGVRCLNGGPVRACPGCD